MELKLVAALATGLFLLSAPAVAQPAGGAKVLVEKKVTNLPAGQLFWRIDNFATAAQAQAAAGPTGLVTEAAGKVWLFTLGPAGKAPTGGTKVTEIGPLPPVTASEYLLEVREITNPPKAKTPVHSHPGAESSYVLSGEVTFRTPKGVTRVAAGQSATGAGAGTPMQATNNGSTESHSLVMFVLDASKPFSSPAKF